MTISRRRLRSPPTTAQLLVLLALCATLAACGQRGPLYLPDEPAPPAPAASESEKPAPMSGETSGEASAADEVFADDFDDDDDERR